MGVMTDERPSKRDMVLPPGTYAYMQDVAKGIIKTYTGPTVINPTAQEVPVIYDPETGSFKRVDLDAAVRKSIIAPEGFYIILLNPAAPGNKAPEHPQEGQTQAAADLDVGRKVVIAGPAMFPLWPGQAAHVIRGHQIRLNQYLLARVYNEEEAKKNWTQAVMKPVTGGTDTDSATEEPQDFTVGTQIVIRGDQISFYIPPTGIAVVKDEEREGAKDPYVREALTLERLEYCILIDEDGNKRYEKGPKVVFPLPSEKFVEVFDFENRDAAGQPTKNKKFRAIELNEIQGLHIKVIADYKDKPDKEHPEGLFKAGEELFITGKDTAIYYPREEHSAIKYDGKAKHFATAIPAGEARYVMNRKTGDIRTVKGPAMLLPDPRNEVVVRRTLSDKQATLWYPGNEEVREYNRALRELLQNVPTTRQGALSEGDISRGASKKDRKLLQAEGRTTGLMAMNFASNAVMESSQLSGDQRLVGEEFSRGSTYTQPRTVDLNTKFQGAPTIQIWTGFACLVVSKTGKRRVEKGPQQVILDYDENLEVLELSTGKPKNTDNLLRTVYLRVDNNKVSDIVQVETADHVQLQLYLSYLINFEGADEKWFAVENYVKFACDHIRSILKGAVRKLKVEEFYSNSTDLIRDILLGKAGTETKKRTGLVFHENGMQLTDVEVLKVQLMDDQIRNMLEQSQKEVVRTNIEMSTLRRNLDLLKQKEGLSREEMATRAETKKLNDQTSIDLLSSQLTVKLTDLKNKLLEIEQEKQSKRAAEELNDLTHAAALERQNKAAEAQHERDEQVLQLELKKLTAETKAVVDRFQAAQVGFSESLTALSNRDLMIQVAKAWGIQNIIGGDNVSDALTKIFKDTPAEGLAKKLVAMAANGHSTPPVAAPPTAS